MGIERPDEFDAEGKQLLAEFRRMASSLAASFHSRRDNVRNLLGSTQNYSSGVFREGLFRDFLREFLPRAAEVGTGFVHGFERVPNSGQLDVLIWDSSSHAPVYRTDSFVVIPPEAAIAAVSVKSRCEKADVIDAITNLVSLASLDLAYRGSIMRNPLPPIGKFILTFAGPRSADVVLEAAAQHCQAMFAAHQDLANAVVPVLRDMNPFDPSEEHIDTVDRALPEFMACLDNGAGSAFMRGWGPGHEILSGAPFGVKRLPYIYAAGTRITTAFEKLIYHILSTVYRFLQTRGRSLSAAWGDFDPIHGFRIGDAGETKDDGGAPLLNPETVLPPNPPEAQVDLSGASRETHSRRSFGPVADSGP